MHILLIPSWYTTKKNPTRGKFFYAQAQALKNAGHQVGLLVPPSRFRTFNGLREVQQYWRQKNTDISITEENGIPIYRIPWWGWIPSVIPTRRGALGIEIYERYVREQGKPDILHAHGILYGGYVAAYIGNTQHIPSVVTEHNSMFIRHLVQPGQMPFVRYTMRHADRMLAVSGSLAEALKPLSEGQSIDVVGNVIDTDFFVPASTPPPENPFVFTCVGGMDSNKAQDLLLRAFADRLKGAEAHLNLIGDGPKLNDYRRLSSELSIDSQVTFCGQQLPTEVRRIVQNSHVVVSTSKVETFGVSLVEGMACGKPVVATRSGGPESFIDESNGISVDVGDQQALGAALVKVRADYHRYNPQAIRQMCVEKFSEPAIASQLEAIYKSLLKER